MTYPIYLVTIYIVIEWAVNASQVSYGGVIMSKMSNSEYNEAKKYIQDMYRYGSGSKESYIQYMKSIINKYDDGYECAKQLDEWNDKWTVFGKDL